ncbi:tyrosine--tRNA ligase, partial [candidate division KSB1 bacterium]|nr:tyrosine--tRNA ligase [candidate division KSB1 bacterium]
MAGKGVLQELEKRNFIQQVTDPELIESLMATEKVTLYLGIDPTADSLHVGHLMGVMVLAHMQRYGHRPIAILGGGTALVGDPSGKTEMRKMLTPKKIQENGEKIKAQLGRYLHFGPDGAMLIDNHDWLGNLNYIDFLRDIGRHFSVNRMLTYETYKRRLETGLSFLEFNYQLLQAYDFYMLFKRYNCRLQVGGDDQWANILAGADLIRRIEGEDAFGLTFPLITTATGAKMGKTEKGALWLDAKKTTPYEYYQYWVNVDDRDVVRFLNYFTFLPVEEIAMVESLGGADLNIVK